MCTDFAFIGMFKKFSRKQLNLSAILLKKRRLPPPPLFSCWREKIARNMALFKWNIEKKWKSVRQQRQGFGRTRNREERPLQRISTLVNTHQENSLILLFQLYFILRVRIGFSCCCTLLNISFASAQELLYFFWMYFTNAFL